MGDDRIRISAKELAQIVAAEVKTLVDARVATAELKLRAYVDQEVQARVAVVLGQRRVAGR